MILNTSLRVKRHAVGGECLFLFILLFCQFFFIYSKGGVMVSLAAVFPEAMVTAAEPPEAAVLTSAHCVVVAPSDALSACHVTVEGTIAELSLYPDGTTVEPTEVAASAADPLEVSVVLSYELSSCAMEAVCKSLSFPVTAMEAVCESLSCPVTAMEAVCDLLTCSELAMEACNELWSCPNPTEEATSELSALSVSPKDAGCEISD